MEFYWTFGMKVMIGEKSPSEEYAKGVLDRSFSFASYAGNPSADIKETLEYQGDPQRLRRYNELMDFRKLMLVYHLIHFKDAIPDIDINIQRRNKELCKPYIQLFHGSDSQEEVEQTLEKFLRLKNERKSTSIENVLLPLITNLTAEENGSPIPTGKIWNQIVENLEGDPVGNNEFQSVEYGGLYRNTIIQKIKDKFGPIPVRLSGGKRAWQCNIDKLHKIAKSYSTEIKIKTTLKTGDKDDSSDSISGNDSYPETDVGSGTNPFPEDPQNNGKVNKEIKDNEVNDGSAGTENNPCPFREPSQPSQSSLTDSDKDRQQYEHLIQEQNSPNIGKYYTCKEHSNDVWDTSLKGMIESHFKPIHGKGK